MNDSLQQFAHQLAVWAEKIIEHGRLPFRKVDTWKAVETPLGRIDVPLILWINRQSLMTGGILLLPENSLDEELMRGRYVAEALGLSHFATWERHQVRIWQCQEEDIVEHQSFPIADPTCLEAFHFILEDVMNALKLTAVIGAIPAQTLSADYFNNLIEMTLQQALPATIEFFRSHRSHEDLGADGDSDGNALEASRLVLLKVLATLGFGELPDSIMPENLQATLEESCHQLPEHVQNGLCVKTTAEDPQLPMDSTVAIHHLLLRLRQLSWGASEARVQATLTKLKDNWFPARSGFEQGDVLIYPEAPPHRCVDIVLSHSATLLALEALLHKETCPLPHLLLGRLFLLDKAAMTQTTIHAKLTEREPLGSATKNEALTQLRKAWPHRRFNIKSGHPIWFWELIHLLGICHPQQNLNLELPMHALHTASDELIWQLIHQHFQILRVAAINNRIKLELSRQEQKSAPSVQHEETVRELTPETRIDLMRANILLALFLPDSIYNLIGQELLWQEPVQGKSDVESGLTLYRNSRCHKLIQAHIAIKEIDGSLPPEHSESTDSILAPSPDLLKQLVAKVNSISGEGPETIDRQLAEALLCPDIETISPIEQKQNFPDLKKKGPKTKEIVDAIKKQAENLGIPTFPEQYLYFLENPEMKRYRIKLPLVENNTFLNEFTLVDNSGKQICGTGEELKQALMVCSQIGKSEFDLPVDLNQINTMLIHYQKDLRALYKFVSKAGYSHHSNVKDARKLVKKIWKKLALPAPGWFNE